MEKADIGLIGLAVMGQNLALNINDHGFRLAVFNRSTNKVDDFINGPASGTQIIGTHYLEQPLVGIRARPLGPIEPARPRPLLLRPGLDRG